MLPSQNDSPAPHGSLVAGAGAAETIPTTTAMTATIENFMVSVS